MVAETLALLERSIMLKGRGLFGVILAAAVAAAGCGSGSIEVTVSGACDEVVCPANQVCEPITGLCIGSGLDADGNNIGNMGALSAMASRARPARSATRALGAA